MIEIKVCPLKNKKFILCSVNSAMEHAEQPVCIVSLAYPATIIHTSMVTSQSIISWSSLEAILTGGQEGQHSFPCIIVRSA